MSPITSHKRFETRRMGRLALTVACTLTAVPAVAGGEIIWSGDYETGDFLQWHREDDDRTAMLSGTPPYGRPGKAAGESNDMNDGYYGDGSLLKIVTHPVRQGRYAARFIVRNKKNGREPKDCDSAGKACDRRRTELRVQRTLPLYYNAIPYQSERWLSVSHFVPEDWERGGSGFGPHVFQIKPLNDRYTDRSGGLGPCLSIQIKDQGWVINHRWSNTGNKVTVVPRPQRVEYSQKFPSANGGDGGEDLRADFPDQQASQAALADLNKGGWTDWVMRVRFDARGSGKGGAGFITIWKRAGEADWVQVLDIQSRRVRRDGSTYDRGVCYHAPPRGSNPGGFGILAGMYMAKSQVWDLERDRVIYNDNIKVGSAQATFQMMSPDGSTPGGAAPAGGDAPPGGDAPAGSDAPPRRPQAPRLTIQATSNRGPSPEVY